VPRPALRTRSRRRVYRRTPGGRTVIHYEKRKPGPARCAICGTPLNGVPRLRPVELRKLPLSQRRPERIFGGVLCVKCLEKLLKKTVREQVVAKLEKVIATKTRESSTAVES